MKFDSPRKIFTSININSIPEGTPGYHWDGFHIFCVYQLHSLNGSSPFWRSSVWGTNGPGGGIKHLCPSVWLVTPSFQECLMITLSFKIDRQRSGGIKSLLDFMKPMPTRARLINGYVFPYISIEIRPILTALTFIAMFVNSLPSKHKTSSRQIR